jgi:hypothetical protein
MGYQDFRSAEMTESHHPPNRSSACSIAQHGIVALPQHMVRYGQFTESGSRSSG